MALLRDEGVSQAMRNRREKMRPYVEAIAKDFADVLPEKRAGRIKKVLMKQLGFREAFSYDHRTILADINSILVPGPRDNDPGDDWPFNVGA
jgi:hypothetical protein